MQCRLQPCETCPYRKDVPSGVWDAREYVKLIEYDHPTPMQPLGVFFCHTSPDFVCNGWAICHGANPRCGYELLSLRFAAVQGDRLEEIPPPAVPLFASGREAAEHGMREIDQPGVGARRAVAKLEKQRARKASRERESMSLATTKGKDYALAMLANRRASPPQRIDNSALPAGSPMTFYCHSCGAVSEVLPENFIGRPLHLCEECRALQDLGWLI